MHCVLAPQDGRPTHVQHVKRSDAEGARGQPQHPLIPRRSSCVEFQMGWNEYGGSQFLMLLQPETRRFLSHLCMFMALIQTC